MSESTPPPPVPSHAANRKWRVLFWVTSMVLILGSAPRRYWDTPGELIISAFIITWIAAVLVQVTAQLTGRFAARTSRLRLTLAAMIATNIVAPNLRTALGILCVRAGIAAEEDRYGDALQILDRIAMDAVPAEARSFILNLKAWALAQAGDPQRAVEVAREAIQETPTKATPLQRAGMSNTLGVALLLSGDAREALPLLLAGIHPASPPPATAITAFYLAEAHRALGHDDDAQRTYEQSIAAAPASTWARRAREALAAMRPFR